MGQAVGSGRPRSSGSKGRAWAAVRVTLSPLHEDRLHCPLLTLTRPPSVLLVLTLCEK